MAWTADSVPDQSGRRAVVTGANSGIGLEAAKALAAAGAQVVLACRDTVRADEAAAAIRAVARDARLELRALDLSSLSSIHDFATGFCDAHDRLDLLINNAGVMAIPRRTTSDGFEMQLGTNHLGHFALTGLLLGRLLASPAPRVVTVSSNAHRMGRIDFSDLHGERRYSRWAAYGQSKLANLLFTRELARRAAAADLPLVAAACHPGWSATNLQSVALRMEGARWLEWAVSGLTRRIAQEPAMGALPTLYAATHPAVRAGDYIGPDGFAEIWGHPKAVGSSGASRSRDVARRLWEVSEALTGVRYKELGP